MIFKGGELSFDCNLRIGVWHEAGSFKWPKMLPIAFAERTGFPVVYAAPKIGISVKIFQSQGFLQTIIDKSTDLIL